MINWKKGITLALTGVFVTSMLSGCKVDRGTSEDPKTINVEMSKLSYGVSWAYEVAEKFEKAFAEEGYKVNFLKPSADMRGSVVVNQLMQGYEGTGVDMYITGSVSSNQVGKEGAYGVIAEELSSLWEKKAIGYDGKEESKTLREKTTAGIYDSYKDIYGDVYGVPYTASTGGMVVNTRKLGLYGIETLPRTSDELFEMWTTIYCGANGMGDSVETDLYPFTYMPGTTNAYTIDWFTLCMAQYDEKLFDEYWSWQTENADGTYTWWEDDVTAAANDAMLASLEVMAQAFDGRIAARGTAMQSLDQAQAQIMKRSKGAIFMCNASWYLNDMALGYKDSLQDLTFINFPVVSKLADKLWADTVTDASKREEMLRYAITQVDDLTKIDDAAAIAEDMTTHFFTEVTTEDVEDIRRARYVYSNRTTSNLMLMTKDTPKREICELFMRMIASDDAAKTLANTANVVSAYTKEPNTTHEYEFVRAASRIRTSEYATAKSNHSFGYRNALGRTSTVAFTSHIPAYIAAFSDALSIYNGHGGMSGYTVQIYKDFAAKMLQNEKTALEEQFPTWKDFNSARVELHRELLNPVS